MADDLSNVWGTNIVIVTKSEERAYGAQSSELLIDEFKRIVSIHFNNDFLLHRICQDGSTANLFAMIDSTCGDTSSCLVATGSYLSAADTFLQNLSTSLFNTNSTLCLIRKPDDDDTKFVRQQIVPLPYAIKGTLSPVELDKYEDECLIKVHEKCLLQRIEGRPVKSMILELMLAGNGATLSDRALEKLAMLSHKHKFTFIIDEIMTGARTGSMLFLHKKPMVFVQCVSHVTLGKWIHLGLLLISKSYHSIDLGRRRPNTIQRYASSHIDLKPIIPIWNKTVKQLSMCQSRREQVLDKLKCSEDEIWGEGCLIFAPINNKSGVNLKCRYLPMLESSPIQKGFNTSMRDTVSKYYVNQQIMEAIIAWKDLDLYDEYSDNKEYLLLIRYLNDRSKTMNNDFTINIEEIDRGVLNHLHNKRKIGDMLRKMELAGIVTYKIAGSKRARSWVVKDDCRF